MEVHQDYKELLKLFNGHNVEYVIVGAFTLAFYGHPRYTGDLDLLVEPDTANAERIITAIHGFGFELLNLSVDDFTLPGKIVQLGVAPVRIDIITSLTGVPWADVEQHRVKGPFGDIEVFYLGRDEFIANKKALGRHKDLADIEELSP